MVRVMLIWKSFLHTYDIVAIAVATVVAAVARLPRCTIPATRLFLRLKIKWFVVVLWQHLTLIV